VTTDSIVNPPVSASVLLAPSGFLLFATMCSFLTLLL
jgi:hypothetical protein